MSGKPEDIPQDVWDDAVAHLSRAGWHMRSAQIAVAGAILAARERAAEFIERRPGEITERQFLADAIRAGHWYDASGEFVSGWKSA